MSEGHGSRLPAGWSTTQLSQLVTPRAGKADPQASPHAKFIGMEQVEAHTMRLLGIVPAGTMRSAANTFESGDVLYGRLRAYLNKVYQPEFDGYCSGEFIVLPQSAAVQGRFLKYRLNAGDFVRFASHINTGDRPRVDWDQVKVFEVHLPPVNEQVRIADAIDEMLSDLDAGVKALEGLRAKLRQYRAAVLKAAVEGTLTADWRKAHPHIEAASELLKHILAERRRRWEEAQLKKYKDAGKEPPKNWRAKYVEPVAPEASKLPPLPEGWSWTTVDQLAAPEPHAITDGPFGSNLMTSHYTDAGPRVVRLQNIGEMCFIDERAHISQSHFESLKKHSVKAGDIVIAALGEALPRACVIPESLGPAIVKADCVRFRTHAANSASALCGFLNSLPTRAQMSQVVHGVGRPRLNLGEIKGIALPLPPAEEQEAIAAEIEDQLSVIDHLDFDIEAKLKSAQALRQSMLKAAFEGKLVPQDPNDEPASELLKRIAAERAQRERLAKDAKAAKPAKVRRPKRGQNMSAVSAG